MKLIKLLIILSVMLFGAQIELNFKNLEIKDFIKMVAKITNKNILLTNDIRGEVNFISVKPVNENEIYDILLNILRSKGYTIVSEHGYLKVVRSSEALREAPSINSKSPFQITTDIIKLKNITAKEAYTQISYLKSRYGKIVINNEKNMLIITDYPKNLKVIKQLLSKIDTLNKPDIIYFNLKNTQINKVYPKISDIAKTLFNPRIYKYKIIKNDNNNGVILVGEKKVIEKILINIKKLDTKPKQLNQITEIITLKNSDVSNMSKIISKIVSLKYKKNKPSVTEDKETNSLIIIATPEQMDTIKTIISALDIPKMQVYVKARILEISNLKASQIGAKLGLFGGSATSSGLYTMSLNMGGPAIASLTDIQTLGLSIPTIRQGLALGATIDLLETFGAAKKLSEPSILCINNTPSSIYVGKTVSVKTGQTTSTSTSVSYSRQDIGLTLDIKPRIDSDDKVSLDVKAVVEDILPGSPDNTLPITSKRDIKTTTIVNNGQSIIIGGLVKNNKDITIKKVPFFGDIPILGALFRHKEVNEDRTTLVIVLTPYIVKKSKDLDKLRLTLGKLNELERKFAIEYINKRKLNETDK
ncbi:type II and III secretion system protein:NolW [Nautilia sp. PV-1]|uniref:secretin N-terminal domain-containing protein n=1 Tax=Nautilia sp. PV-1 TaxID=2579250 RepID=UPI000FDACB1B|nr:secretin N-terminal domain-containing protein [Nautilia sp. PV-1]AZV45721.1 type II and III secretion system protein:NolW [Nautilia sp. PV-1]